MDQYDNVQAVSQPNDLSIKLYRHQLASIYQMESIEREKMVEGNDFIKETMMGVNANLQGYGKTLEMIGLMVRDKMEWDLEIPYVFETVTSSAKGRIKKRKVMRKDKLNATLILAPSSIVHQWENELKYTSLKTTTVTSSKDIDRIEPELYDVIIVSPSMYNNLLGTNSKYAWKRFIFDEPGHTRIPYMKEVMAGFYWFVTATPIRS